MPRSSIRASVGTDQRSTPLTVNGVDLVADLAGGLWWPARSTLIVADLHLEKGTALGRSRRHLPPYDTAETLRRLARLTERYGPERIICLGDSFHDEAAHRRLPPLARTLLEALARPRQWLWVAGNHDPGPTDLGIGSFVEELHDGPLVFRHEARADGAGEISGHFHPKASVRVRLGRISGRCFVADRRRAMLPAFGAYTGGLNVTDPAIRSLFADDFAVRLMGRDRLFTIPGGGLTGR